jgi:hypothetical protein
MFTGREARVGLRCKYSGALMVKTQKLFAVSATWLLASLASAHAATVTVGESYTITETGFTGNQPSISDKLNGNLTLTNNTWSTATSFFTASPANSSGLRGRDPTVTGTLNVTLNFTEAGGITGSVTESALYEAKYGGSALSGCTNSSGPDTDCIVWNGASNTPNGSVILAATMSNGSIIDVDFYNAQDWAITPTISFDLRATPLPATLPLFVSGLGILGLIAQRRKRKIAAAQTEDSAAF